MHSLPFLSFPSPRIQEKQTTLSPSPLKEHQSPKDKNNNNKKAKRKGKMSLKSRFLALMIVVFVLTIGLVVLGAYLYDRYSPKAHAARSRILAERQAAAQGRDVDELELADRGGR